MVVGENELFFCTYVCDICHFECFFVGGCGVCVRWEANSTKKKISIMFALSVFDDRGVFNNHTNIQEFNKNLPVFFSFLCVVLSLWDSSHL